MAHKMTNPINNSAGPRTDSVGWSGGLFRVAVIGAATLKGRELKEVLTDRNFPSIDVRLLDDEESLGQLQAIGEEPTFIQSVLPEHLDNVDFTFFAADENFTRNTWKMSQSAGSDIIDLSYALEDESGVLLRAPWIERELGVPPRIDFSEAPVVIAHPAAIVLALLLLRAQKVGKIARAIVTVLEPASEHGRRGMDELHEQTINLLSFQQLPKGVFDTQVAFNVLDRYGEGRCPRSPRWKPALASLPRALWAKAGRTFLMLLQAPIFHGHAFSLYIEFENAAQTRGDGRCHLR